MATAEHNGIAVLAPMFDDYAEKHMGYPCEAYGWTDEKWTAYLREIAQHLRNCDEDQQTNPNEYGEEWAKVLETKWNSMEIVRDDAGLVHHNWPEPTPEQKELEENYRRREEEVFKWRSDDAVKAFEMIGAVFFDLWD